MAFPPIKKKGVKVMPVFMAFVIALRRYKALSVGMLTGALVIELAALASPLVLKQLIDTLSGTDPAIADSAAILGIIFLLAIANFTGWIGQRIRMLSWIRVEARVMSDLSNQAFQYLLRHSHEFFTSNFTGTLTRRVNRYGRAFQQVLAIGLNSFFSSTVFAIGAIIILFGRSPLLGGILLFWTIAFIIVQVFVARWKHPLRLAMTAEDSKVSGVLSDAISNQPTVNQFAAARFEFGIFDTALAGWRKAAMRLWNADAWVLAIQGLFAIAIETALLIGAVLLWQKGAITVGDFVLIQVYVLGLINRLWNLGNSMRNMFAAIAEAHEMVEILNMPHAVADVPGAPALKVTEGKIELRDVAFGYGSESAVMQDFNLSVASGERIALVGPSGAGKSTITKLLLRMHDVTAGTVEIDGQDTATVTQDSLREAIAYVPQEPILFHRSLMDNIRYGRRDATDEQVIEAAKQARCHDFIAKLPLGYDTQVGERGIKLSGGERQRVAIARAILKDAPILILDEATSSLDSESEALIQEALDILMRGKTVIVIAHRLSTIMRMDRIVVIEGGRIAAEGTHQELLDHEGGLYHKLWSIQAGSFVADTEESEAIDAPPHTA